jgi:hypothetical protein
MQHEWGENRNAYRILVGKPEGKRSLGEKKDVGGWTKLTFQRLDFF